MMQFGSVLHNYYIKFGHKLFTKSLTIYNIPNPISLEISRTTLIDTQFIDIEYKVNVHGDQNEY